LRWTTGYGYVRVGEEFATDKRVGEEFVVDNITEGM
jgi:hypothetical protein